MMSEYPQVIAVAHSEEWKTVPLGTLVKSIEYGSSSRSKSTGAVPVLRMGNLQSGKIDWSNLVYTDNAVEIHRYELKSGDVLFNRTNTADLVGKTSIFVGDQKAIFAGYLIRIVTREECLDPRYLNYVMNSEIARKYSLMVLSLAVGQANINGEKLKTYPIPLPTTLAEQCAIANILNDVDNLIDGLDRLIAKKRDLKQAAMQQLLTRKTRLPGFAGEWEVKRLGDLTDLNRQNVIPASQPGSPFVHFSLPAFDDGKHAKVELGAAIGSNKFRVPSMAVLVSKLNPRIPRIWAPKHVPENACASTEWLILTPRAGVEREFLFVLCSSPSFYQQMEIAATGTTGSHQRISPNTALNIRVSVPLDPKEQTAIAAVLIDMDSELSAIEAKRDKTRNLKQAMMQALLTGRTRFMAQGTGEPACREGDTR